MSEINSLSKEKIIVRGHKKAYFCTSDTESGEILEISRNLKKAVKKCMQLFASETI